MGYYRPPASGYRSAVGDDHFTPIEGVRLETELASAYRLEQLGIRSDSEVAVNRLRGEAFSAQVGDYVSTLQLVSTPTASFVIEVTTKDIGTGQDSQSLVDIQAAYEARNDIIAERNRQAEADALAATFIVDVISEQGVQAPEQEVFFEIGPAAETQVETIQYVQPEALPAETQPPEPEVIQPEVFGPEYQPDIYAGGYSPYEEIAALGY